MSAGLGPLVPPDLRAILQMHSREIFTSLNCHQVGKILEFNVDTQLARVQLTIKRVVFNKEQDINSKLQLTNNIVDYPLLVDCPVFILFGGGARLTMPIKKGDTCLVLFGDRDIDNWLISGSPSPPNSERAHSLSDGFALVGYRHNQNSFSSYPADDAQLTLGGGKHTIKANGNQELSSPAGGVIQIEDLIQIKNNATTLLAVMNLLVTALTALNGKTGPSAAAQIAAFNASLTTLLKT